MQQKLSALSPTSPSPSFDFLISEAEKLVQEFLSEDKNKTISSNVLSATTTANQRAALRDLLYKAILMDPLQASKQDLDTKLWRLVFYDPITEARRHARLSSKVATKGIIGGGGGINALSGQRSVSESAIFEASVLTRLINTGIGTYTLLLHNLLERFKRRDGDLPLLASKGQAILGQMLKSIQTGVDGQHQHLLGDSSSLQVQFSSSSSPPHGINYTGEAGGGQFEPLVQAMIYRLCLCLGDLFRYGAEAMQGSLTTTATNSAASRQSMSTSSLMLPLHNNYAPAMQVYQHAIRLYPSLGHGYNQMAVITGTASSGGLSPAVISSTSSIIQTVYYYLSAISVKEPFVPVALRNLEVFVEKAGTGKAASHKRSSEEKSLAEQTLLFLVKKCCFEASSGSTNSDDTSSLMVALEEKHLEMLTLVDLLCLSASLVMLSRLTKLIISQQRGISVSTFNDKEKKDEGKKGNEEDNDALEMTEDHRLRLLQQAAHQILQTLVKSKTHPPHTELVAFAPALVTGYLLFEISSEEERKAFASHAVHGNNNPSLTLSPSLTASSILPSIDFYLLPLGYESEAQLIAQRAPRTMEEQTTRATVDEEDEDEEPFDSQGSSNEDHHREKNSNDRIFGATNVHKKVVEHGAPNAPNPFITLPAPSIVNPILGPPDGASSASSITALLSSVIKNPSAPSGKSSLPNKPVAAPLSSSTSISRQQAFRPEEVSSPIATPSQSFSIQPAQEGGGTKSPTPRSFKSTGSAAAGVNSKTTQPIMSSQEKLDEPKKATLNSPVAEPIAKPFLPASILEGGGSPLPSEISVGSSLQKQQRQAAPSPNISLEQLFAFSSGPTTSAVTSVGNEGKVNMLDSLTADRMMDVDEQGGEIASTTTTSDEQQNKFIEDLLASPTKKPPPSTQERKAMMETRPLSEVKPSITQAVPEERTLARGNKPSPKKEAPKQQIQQASAPKQSTAELKGERQLPTPSGGSQGRDRLEEMVRDPNFDPMTLLAGPIQTFALAQVSTQIPLLRDPPEYIITNPMMKDQFKSLLDTNSEDIYYTPQYGPGSLFYTNPVKQADGSMLHFHCLDLNHLPS